MSYMLVMWSKKDEKPANTKVENLTETGGLIHLPLGAGSYSMTLTAITAEEARAYRKAEAKGENPIEAIFNEAKPKDEDPNIKPEAPVGDGQT